MLTFAESHHQTAGPALGSGIGDAIRRARRASGLSGEALAKMVGVSRRTIIKVEQADETVAFGTYRAVARTLGLDWLFDIFALSSDCGALQAPAFYLSGMTALCLPPPDGRPPALWYSSSLSNCESWRIAGKHLAHTGVLLGVAGLWDATSVIAQYGVNVPCIWAASPERATFDLLIEHCEIRKGLVPNVRASDIDDVVDLIRVAEWVTLCAPFLSEAGKGSIDRWLDNGGCH